MSMNPWWGRTIRGCEVNREMFIETGSRDGATIAQALQQKIPVIHSIEIRPDAYGHCYEQFRSDKQVRLHLGDSRKILPLIIEPSKPTTFYLDAHYSGDNIIIDSDTECPILEEMRIIVNMPWTTWPVVIADDTQLFQREWCRGISHIFKRSDWPPFPELIEVMKDYICQEFMEDHKNHYSGIWTHD